MATIDKEYLEKQFANFATVIDETFAKIIAAGCDLGLDIDPVNYVMTMSLKNANGQSLATKSIDFPLESMVVDGDLDEETGEFTLILQNGNTIGPYNMSSIVHGLVKDTFTIAGIDMKDDITAEELKAALRLDDDYLPLTGGTMEGNINMNGHRIFAKHDNFLSDIDMVSSYMEIGVRNSDDIERFGDWLSRIQFLINSLKIKSESITIDSNKDVHINGYDNNNLIKMVREGDGNKINIVIGNNAYSLEINENGIYINNGMLSIKENGGYFITNDTNEGMTIYNKNADHDMVISSASKLKIASIDNVNIRSKNGDIRLIPGSSSDSLPPNPNNYVKTGNIQGVKDTDDNKPNITNFNEIHANIFEENGKRLEDKYLPLSGGTMEENTFIGFIDSSGIASGITIESIDRKYRASFTSAECRMYDVIVYNTIVPEDTDSVDIGYSNGKFRNIYATNGIIQTSDINEKDNIKLLTEEQAKDLIMNSLPKSFTMINGTHGRTHFGMIAQDVEKLLEELGWSDMDFAGFIKSPKVITIKEDEDGNPLKKPIEKVVEGEYIYGLRYQEYIPAIIRVEQSHEDEINSLKETIKNQNERIEALEQMVQQLLGA